MAASSPSLSASSSPSPVQDIDSSSSYNGTSGNNFPYDHLTRFPLGSASVSVPYLPIAMTQSPVSEMPPPITMELSGPIGRTLASRTSHPHLQHLHIQPPVHPSHPGSPFQSPPLSASHSGSSASGCGSGGYFPLVHVDSNERHRPSHHHQQQQLASVPTSPFEATFQTHNAGVNGYGHAYPQQPHRIPSQGYPPSSAWPTQ
ncbi:hypothetical protein FB446DRAFT_792271 [Lentinula raphanica]|nr:hypothetical protein FB446DRAFT_792271 [Lentinula raphanica]